MSEVKLTIVDPRVDLTICDDDVAVHITDSGPQGPQGPRGSQVLSGTVDPSPIIGLVGDQYINTTTGYIFGPKTESSWPTGVSLGTGLSIDEVSYVHDQVSASDTWVINHGLPFVPNITVVDYSGSGEEVIGNYVYGNGTITAHFTSPFAGRAYLS